MDNMGSNTKLSPDDVVNLFRHAAQQTMRRTVVRAALVALVDWVFVATALIETVGPVTVSIANWSVLVKTGFVTTALITNWSVTSPASPSPP